jgi:hypothetical protein
MSLPDARPPMQAEEAGIAGLKGDAMLTKCCHPECHAPFDFREGRLIRFSRGISNGQSAESQRLIEHFWLCGKCAEIFVFECESGMCVKIKSRAQELSEEHLPHFISAA